MSNLSNQLVIRYILEARDTAGIAKPRSIKAQLLCRLSSMTIGGAVCRCRFVHKLRFLTPSKSLLVISLYSTLQIPSSFYVADLEGFDRRFAAMARLVVHFK